MYSPNSQYQFYNLKAKPDPPTLMVSPGAWSGNVGTCSQVTSPGSEFNYWAKGSADSPTRLNVDGVAIQMNTCLNKCNSSEMLMTNPVPFQPNRNYVLAGGLMIAPKVFAYCGR